MAMQTNNPPVSKGEVIEVELINEGKKERNMVAKFEGYIIFIQECDGTIGDIVKVEVTGALPKYGFAIPVNV